MPTCITVGDSVRVREVSCGSSHSACVTDKGELYVWGCADGGRLGLGIQRQETQFRPVKVSVNGSQGFPPVHKGVDHREGSPAFGGQKLLHVSCGNAHTLVSTVIREVVTGSGPTRTRIKVSVWCVFEWF